jgi:putative phage-type endonuclease
MIRLVNIDKEKDYDGWLNFRSSGIGASDVGTILGLNPYKSSAELFYQKIGKIPQKIQENLAMFMGTRMEPLVASLWEYYDVDEDKMIQNYNTGVKTRHGSEIVGYLINDKYPHLFFSPDRLICNNSKLPAYSIDGDIVSLDNVRGILEIKTISGFASKQWEGGVPPSYVTQLMTYLMGLELNYGEIAFFEDGRKLNVIEMSFNESIGSQILQKTTEFWERVQGALEDIENCELYEPEPDGTEAYESFLNKKYSQSQELKISGTDEMYQIAHNHKLILDEIKDKEYEARECTNRLKDFMGEAEVLDFGDSGKVTWKSTVKGNRLFKNSIKL